MAQRSLLNRSESKSFELLDRTLGGSRWCAWPKVRVRDVLPQLAEADLTLPESGVYRMGHFDFVVVDSAEYRPEFAIEFDGPLHSDGQQKARDTAKDCLCGRVGLPLLRLGAGDIVALDQYTYLEWLLRRFIVHRSWKGQEGQNPWVFDVQAPFPGTLAVIQRLYSRYGIVCAEWWGWGGETASLGPVETAPLVVYPDPSYLAALSFIDVDPSPRRFVETGVASVVVFRGDDPIFHGQGSVSVVPLDAGPLRLPSNYGSANSIAGMDYWELRAAIAEYHALRDVERWAMRTLASLAA